MLFRCREICVFIHHRLTAHSESTSMSSCSAILHAVVYSTELTKAKLVMLIYENQAVYRSLHIVGGR